MSNIIFKIVVACTCAINVSGSVLGKRVSGSVLGKRGATELLVPEVNPLNYFKESTVYQPPASKPTGQRWVRSHQKLHFDERIPRPVVPLQTGAAHAKSRGPAKTRHYFLCPCSSLTSTQIGSPCQRWFNTQRQLARHIFKEHVRSDHEKLYQRGQAGDRWVKAIDSVLRENVHNKARQNWTDVLSKLQEAREEAARIGADELATFRLDGLELVAALRHLRDSQGTWNSEDTEGLQALVDALEKL